MVSESAMGVFSVEDDPLGGESEFGFNDPAEVFDDGWSPPILFFPNGRTSQATLEIRTTDGYEYRETLFLRGLTGTASMIEQ